MWKLFLGMVIGQLIAYTVAYYHQDAVAAVVVPPPQVVATCAADQQIKLISAKMEQMPNIKRWAK